MNAPPSASNGHHDPDSEQSVPGPDAPERLSAFRTDLDVFSGPLDLLLHLVRRDEVDVLEIPLADITDQYLQVLRAMQAFDVNVAAEFLVMAATLMDIKSRSLLPDSHIDEDEDLIDPRDELVRQLLQYKKFREAADALHALAEEQAKKFPRIPPKPAEDEDDDEDPRPEDVLPDADVFVLLSAYAEIVRQIEVSQPAHIVYDDVPVQVYMNEVVEALEGGDDRAEFLDLLTRDPDSRETSRARVVGVFLALLELARMHKITVDQDENDRTRIRVVYTPESAIEEPAQEDSATPDAGGAAGQVEV